MGTQLPPPQKGTPPSPIFGLSLVAKQLDGSRYHLVRRSAPRPRPHYARWGPSSRSPKRGHSLPHQFWVHVYCSQGAGWMKTPVGMEVDLGPGYIVLNGDPVPLRMRLSSPLFGPYLLWTNGWMDQDATWYVGKPEYQTSTQATLC